MTANMYRVGDYVYFETTNITPFQIRRIEELNKTPNGNVEARVMCFYRRRDVANNLLSLADKHQNTLEDEGENVDRKILTPVQKHRLKQRELFFSRQLEVLPATHIRGKCSVTLLNETESLLSYLNKEDTFFYCLIYDPTAKSLLADKGEIRVGTKYQAEPPQMLKDSKEDPRIGQQFETLVWNPEHNLTDKQVDQFLVTSRSIGTFARALDCSSSVKQPSLHMSAAAASRDITLFYAMDTLHKHDYVLSDAVSSLVPSTGPVLCRDEMEEWSASEANLFEEALEKYGKEFIDIQHDFLPWKNLKNIIEYYYMWKTTDRYVQQKRVKAVEAESKLKQVYIPNYNKPNPAAINNNKVLNGTSEVLSTRPCESCNTVNSTQWFAWGPQNMKCRLCQNCWNYWKRYGGIQIPTGVLDETDVKKEKNEMDLDDAEIPLENAQTTMTSHRIHRCTIMGCAKEFKVKAQLARHYAAIHGLTVRTGSPRPIMKTRSAFYLSTTPLVKLSRRLCHKLLLPRHAARSPFWPINVQSIKAHCQVKMVGKGVVELQSIIRKRRKDRGSVTGIATRLGLSRNHDLIVPDWLAPTDLDKIAKSERIAFPKPPKASDGSLLYERVPNKCEDKDKIIINMPVSMKRKSDENGLEVESMATSKRIPRPGGGPIGPRTVMNHLNGKARLATMSRTGRKQVITWMDAPDDVYFRSTPNTKKARKRISSVQLKRTARKPWRKLIVKGMEDMMVVLE